MKPLSPKLMVLKQLQRDMSPLSQPRDQLQRDMSPLSPNPAIDMVLILFKIQNAMLKCQWRCQVYKISRYIRVMELMTRFIPL